ncbi:NfeD family protein [Cronobacter dublinensis]|uniref:NfeD family protein n=1 Tax=Cronobacter dublinensis TaxID=413497 RepID=UPI0003A8DD65|nr:NfeD family protein [Cronobacter dublinensis]ELZ8932968.1 NfeD family protein [Cronobacter dublinensis]MDI6428221.1 NfeD family protein [Cronobacter dublinensis]MDT3666711.1 NfeD family protein [Cronobacter dublinensis]WEP46424.1 NfeD family protein [Cronobacter dublinensis]
MMTLILSHPHVFWLCLGGLLLAAEMLGGNGFLLWSGVAAVATGLLAWLLPMGWEWQGVSFALLMLMAVWLWWRLLSRRAGPRPDNALNQRGNQLVGQRFTLTQALINGRGQLTVGDSVWPVIADSDLPAGTAVEVVAIDGIRLRVQARQTD